jgi:hypothetical protein
MMLFTRHKNTKYAADFEARGTIPNKIAVMKEFIICEAYGSQYHDMKITHL